MKKDQYVVQIKEWNPNAGIGEKENFYNVRTCSLKRVLDLMHEHIGFQSCILWVKKNGRTVWKVKPLG